MLPGTEEVSMRTETFPVAISITDVSLYCLLLIFKSESEAGLNTHPLNSK